MNALSPVVWYEGMHIAQHHFQAQSRYFEELTGFTLAQLSPDPWGALEMGLDADALLNGSAAVLHGRGLMPDGTPFNFPHDALPEPLAVTDLFSPTSDAHLLLLGLPAHNSDGANCAIDGEPRDRRRFSAAERLVRDETGGGQERSVSFARRNFRLLLDTEDASGMVTLPLGRIRRDGRGAFVYDPGYVAPVMRIGASARLMDMVGRLVEMLQARAEALASDRRQGSDPLGEYAAREIAGFWLSHAIHAALPGLQGMLQRRAAHPEALFRELSRLAGALCTFSLDAHPRDLPLYEHAAPEHGFTELEAHIRRHLERVLPTGAITVPLQPAVAVKEGKDEVLVAADPPPLAPSFFTATLNDTRVFGRAHWYLGLRSSAPSAEVPARAPELMKICSARVVARMVQTALPGLGLEYVANPPADIGVRINTHYFRIQRTEPCWSAIARSGQVGVYVPASLPDVELSLSVVLEP